MTVNLVLVSHSARLAEGVAELAAEMGGGEVLIEPAGGIDDGAIGTDAERVRAAVERVRSDDGVLVLMDLGSALMSAEIALEMLEAGGPVMLTAAPLVEGAVAAAARARGGAELAEVAAEARGALAAKAAQLGEEDDEAPAEAAAIGDGQSVRLPIGNRLGLHVRPAGRIIELVADHDAFVELRNPARGTGPTDGRSLTGIALLRAVQGDELEVVASGPQASELLAALGKLAAANWGDGPEAAAAARGASGAPARRAVGTSGAAPPAAALSPGATLRGVTAVRGLALGPARWVKAPELDLDALEAGSPEEEAARLDEAVAVARAQLAATAAGLPPAEAEIFAAQALLLDDDEHRRAGARRDRGRRAGGGRLSARERDDSRGLRRDRRRLPPGARDRRA